MTKNKQNRCIRALERLRLRRAKINDGAHAKQMEITEQEIAILESKLGTLTTSHERTFQ